jgi:hypothetical protein
MNFAVLSTTARAASVVASCVAGYGAAHGVHMMNPDGGWITPVVIGGGVAALLAVGWHLTLVGAEHARRTAGIAAVALAAVSCAGIAVSTSAWSLATQIGGRQAIAAHQNASLEAYETALTAVEASALRSSSTATSGIDAQIAALTTQIDAEVSGDAGNGAGCGPVCRDLMRERAELESQRSGADNSAPLAAIGADARAIMGEARAAVARSDDAAVMTSLTALRSRIAEVARVSPDGVAVPAPFRPMGPGEAIAAYAGQVAGAWAFAIGIDLMPLLFVLLVAFLAYEPNLRSIPVSRGRTAADILRDEAALNLASISEDRVTRIRPTV